MYGIVYVVQLLSEVNTRDDFRNEIRLKKEYIPSKNGNDYCRYVNGRKNFFLTFPH